MMKTVEEITDRIARFEGRGTLIRDLHIIRTEIMQYALEACKEQREICASDDVVSDSFFHDQIREAPEPELK